MTSIVWTLPIFPWRTSSQPSQQCFMLRCCVPYWKMRLFSSKTLRQARFCSIVSPSGFST